MTPSASQLTLMGGAAVSYSDGPSGTVSRILINVTSMAVRYLAVEPQDSAGNGRLVPFDHISGDGQQVLLRYTRSEFLALDHSDDVQMESAIAARSGHVVEHQVVRHRVPDGLLEVVTGTEVRATDGMVGYLNGLVVDSVDGRIARALATVGRFFSKKDIAIPAEMIRGIDENGIHLGFSKSVILALR